MLNIKPHERTSKPGRSAPTADMTAAAQRVQFALGKAARNCSPPIQAPKTPQQFQSQLLCQDASFTFGYDDLRRQILILSLRL